jgi:hypothetical protein
LRETYLRRSATVSESAEDGITSYFLPPTLNADEARKNLCLATVASTGSFTDLINWPHIISHIVGIGAGISLVGTTMNGIATVLSLISDGTLKIHRTAGESVVELSINSVPVGLLSGILPPNKGGTGLDSQALAAADAGTVLTLNVNRTFDLRPVPKSGHQIWDEMRPMAQRTKLRFVGDGVSATDDAVDDSTVISFSDLGGKAGRYFAHLFFASEFAGDTLTIPQSAIPFPIIDPLLTVRDDVGNYVETGISVLNGAHIQITAQPFDGKLLICEPGATDSAFSHPSRSRRATSTAPPLSSNRQRSPLTWSTRWWQRSTTQAPTSTAPFPSKATLPLLSVPTPSPAGCCSSAETWNRSTPA